MKTIKELNQKWYWRFIKVIFFFIVFLSIIWIFTWIYSEFHTYNPKDIKTVEERFENFKKEFNHVKVIDEKLDEIYPNFSIDNLLKITSDLKLKNKIPHYLPLIILSKYPKANLDRIWMVCWSWDYCDIEYDSEMDFYDKILNNTWISVPKYKIDEFEENWSFNDILNYISFYDSYKNWNKTINNLMDYYKEIDWYWWTEKFFPSEYFSEYDYRWISEWIKIILYFILSLFWFIIFLFLIRWITYYIIIWKFNPKE